MGVVTGLGFPPSPPWLSLSLFLSFFCKHHVIERRIVVGYWLVIDVMFLFALVCIVLVFVPPPVRSLSSSSFSLFSFFKSLSLFRPQHIDSL